MTYSNAWIDFNIKLREIFILLDNCTNKNGRLQIVRKNINRDNAICRGIIVLITSHLEGYFESLIADVIKCFTINGIKMGDIPESLKVKMLSDEVSNIRNENVQQVWNGIKTISSSVLVNDTRICSIGDIDEQIITRDFGQPGSKKIRKLLNYIGIDNIWSKVNANLSINVNQVIDQLVLKRNKIAHGDAIESATSSDIRQIIKDIKNITKTIDKITKNHLIQYYNIATPW